MFAVIFICGNLFLRSAGKIAKIRAHKNFVPHVLYVVYIQVKLLRRVHTCLQVALHPLNHCGKKAWSCVESDQEAYHLKKTRKYKIRFKEMFFSHQGKLDIKFIWKWYKQQATWRFLQLGDLFVCVLRSVVNQHHTVICVAVTAQGRLRNATTIDFYSHWSMADIALKEC